MDFIRFGKVPFLRCFLKVLMAFSRYLILALIIISFCRYPLSIAFLVFSVGSETTVGSSIADITLM